MQRHYPLNPTTGLEDPTQLPWTNGNPATDQEGSYPPFALSTDAQDEILHVVDEAAIPESSTDLFQLLRAIRSGQLTTFTDTGTANNLSIAPTTAHTALKKGLPFRIFPKLANTLAAVALTVSGLTAPVVKAGGAQPAPADIVAGQPIDVVFDGTSFRLLEPTASDMAVVVATLAPVILKANKTVYVDLATGTSTPGNDTTGDGSAAKPFATINKAIAFGQTFTAAGFGIIVQLVTAGTYAAPGSSVTGVPNLQIVGSASNQAGYVLSGNLPGSTSLVNVSACNCLLNGVTLFVTQASNGWASAGFGGNLVLQNVGFTDSTTSTSPVIGAGNGGTVTIGAGCTIGAAGAGVGAAALYSASANGLIYQTAYLNMLAGCSFGTTVTASDGGRIIIPSNVGFTGAGATTTAGSRYNAAYGGSINVSGAGANAIPGNAAGSYSNGGVYA